MLFGRKFRILGLFPKFEIGQKIVKNLGLSLNDESFGRITKFCPYLIDFTLIF